MTAPPAWGRSGALLKTRSNNAVQDSYTDTAGTPTFVASDQTLRIGSSVAAGWGVAQLFIRQPSWGESVSTAKQIAAIVFLFVAPRAALAECWMVGNFAGYSAKASKQYELVRDGLSSTTIGVNVNGKESSVTHVPGLKCTEISPTAIVCVVRDGEKVITEAYSVDPSMRKAFVTHLRSGYGTLDGVSVYVGNILGQCK